MSASVRVAVNTVAMPMHGAGVRAAHARPAVTVFSRSIGAKRYRAPDRRASDFLRERVLDQRRGFPHSCNVLFREPAEEPRQILDTALTSTLHDASPLRSCVQPVHATVVRVAHTAHEAGGLEALHDARHRRRPHLFGARKRAERARAAEDEHRERGQLRGRHAGLRIRAPHVPKRVNRSRVEAVGSVD